MESNKFEKIIFTLLRVIGVLTIIAGTFFSGNGLFSKEGLIVFRRKTIVGNIFMISPRVIIEMVVIIIVYLIFINIIAKHISISKKSI